MDAVDIKGDLITPADTYSYREYASQYASHQSAYPASPTDVPFSSTSDDYPAEPFLAAPAAPQMPFVSPVPSFGDNDANNHDGFSWAAQYPPVPEQYAPMSAQYPLLPQMYAPLPAQYPPLATYPFTFSPPPQSPPSPSPSDLALSDYTPTPAPSSWTQTAAYHHLAPLTKYALVTRWAAEERAPPFRPRYYLPADKAPLQSPERAARRRSGRPWRSRRGRVGRRLLVLCRGSGSGLSRSGRRRRSGRCRRCARRRGGCARLFRR